VTDEVNPPAFPNVEPRDPRFSNAQPGMDLRDWFAGQAIPALVSVCGADTRDVGTPYEDHCAILAYRIADALLAARKAQP